MRSRRRCHLLRGTLKVVLAAALVMMLPGCARPSRRAPSPSVTSGVQLGTTNHDVRLRTTVITNCERSPSGRLLAFEVTPPSEPRAIYVLRLPDGMILGRLQKHNPVDLAGWSADESSLYVLEDGRIFRWQVATQSESRVTFTLPSEPGEKLRVYHASYVRPLQVFLVKVRSELRGGQMTYAVHPFADKARLVMAGYLDNVALKLLSPKGPLLILAYDRGTITQLWHPTRAPRLHIYYYPAVKPSLTFELPLRPGRILKFGATTSTGDRAVLCYQFYPWDPVQSYLCAVDLRTGTIERQARIDDLVQIVRLPSTPTFLVVGTEVLGTLELDDFGLRPVPGGPVGSPTCVEVLNEHEVAVATAPAAEIYAIDLRSGNRHLLWSPAKGR